MRHTFKQLCADQGANHLSIPIGFPSTPSCPLVLSFQICQRVFDLVFPAIRASARRVKAQSLKTLGLFGGKKKRHLALLAIQKFVFHRSHHALVSIRCTFQLPLASTIIAEANEMPRSTLDVANEICFSVHERAGDSLPVLTALEASPDAFDLSGSGCFSTNVSGFMDSIGTDGSVCINGFGFPDPGFRGSRAGRHSEGTEKIGIVNSGSLRLL